MKLNVIAHPNSKKPRVETDLLNTLHVYVGEPAIEGKANNAVKTALADHYNLPKTSVKMLRGNKSKVKVFEIGINKLS